MHANVVTRLKRRRLTRQWCDQPLVFERLRAQFMLALYRSGRQADALQQYHSIRKLLVDEYAIEPSLELKSLYSAILREAGYADKQHVTTGEQRRDQIVHDLVLADDTASDLLDQRGASAR